jgi:peptidoglycan hydrolase CwlO-like protein
MFKRILGVIILISSLVVLIALLATAFAVGPIVDSIALGLDSALALTDETLTTVTSTLEQTQATLVAVNDTISTASETTDNLAQTIYDSQPLLEGITGVIAVQAPQNIEALQGAIPNIAAVGGVVDDALTALSNFGVSQTIPIPFNPITLDFDLGIDYEPVEPFDKSLSAIGTSLDGLPEQLRSLRSNLEVTTANLGKVGDDIQTATGDLESINAQVAAFIPLLDDYIAIIGQIGATLNQVQAQVAANLSTIKLVGTILPLAVALTQLAPLYVGWELLRGKRDPEVIVQEVEVDHVKEPVDVYPAAVVSSTAPVAAETIDAQEDEIIHDLDDDDLHEKS